MEGRQTAREKRDINLTFLHIKLY